MIGPTELFSRRSEVDLANSTKLKSLPARDIRTYEATDGGPFMHHGISMSDKIVAGSMPKGEQRAKTAENMVAPAVLQLKIDAQVVI